MITHRHRRIAAWLLAVGALALAVVVFWPTPIDAWFADALRDGLAELQAAGAPEVLRYGVIEFAANILMFVPIGFLLAVVLPRGLRWLSPVLCFLLSLGIELGQVVLAYGRLGDVTDVIGNTLGGLLGAALLVVLLTLARARAARRARAASPVAVR